MILTDDNFTTIVHAIEEGRNIYNNIKKSVIFLLSCNLGEVVAIFISVLFFWPVPLIATQLLWINLITDTLPAIALGVDPGDKDIMKKKPRDPKESFFANGAGFRAILGGILIGALTLTAFSFGLREYGYSLGSRTIPEEVLTYARTMAFVVLAGSQLFYSLAMRNPTKSILQVGLFSNMYLIGAIIIGFVLQIAVISVPFLASAFKVQMLSERDWGLVILFSLVPLVLKELSKLFMSKNEKEEL
jgi:Ca2+-transporting ATPase